MYVQLYILCTLRAHLSMYVCTELQTASMTIDIYNIMHCTYYLRAWILHERSLDKDSKKVVENSDIDKVIDLKKKYLCKKRDDSYSV